MAADSRSTLHSGSEGIVNIATDSDATVYTGDNST
jgi:hypothetical protein